MMGQVAFTMVSFSAIFSILMQNLRYRSAADFYDAGDFTGGTNYWKVANYINFYAGAGIWTLAFLSQLLSWLEIGVEGVFFVWIWFVGAVWPLFSVIVHALLFFAYDLAYKDLNNSDSATALKAAIVLKEVKSEWL